MISSQHFSTEYSKPKLMTPTPSPSLGKLIAERTKIRSIHMDNANKWEIYNAFSSPLIDFLRANEKIRFDLSFKAATGNQLSIEENATLAYLNARYDELCPREVSPSISQIRALNAEVRRLRMNGQA